MERKRFLEFSLAAAAPLAAGAAAAPPAPSKIDIHHHIVAPPWLAAYRESLAGLLKANPAVANWTVGAAIEQMDRFGVRTAFTTMSSPNFWGSDLDVGRRLARACNEFAARTALDHPGRFGFFRECTVTRCCIQPDRGRVRLGRAQSRRHWHVDELQRPVGRRQLIFSAVR
jgi:hypothetical protein